MPDEFVGDVLVPLSQEQIVEGLMVLPQQRVTRRIVNKSVLVVHNRVEIGR